MKRKSFLSDMQNIVGDTEAACTVVSSYMRIQLKKCFQSEQVMNSIGL